MNQYTRNSIRISVSIGIGCTIIILFIVFHLLETIFRVQSSYNFLADFTNTYLNGTFSEMRIDFFGVPITSGNLLTDIIISIIIILVGILVFLIVFWMIKDVSRLKGELK